MSASRTLDEILAALPAAHHAPVERRTSALIADEPRRAPGIA